MVQEARDQGQHAYKSTQGKRDNARELTHNRTSGLYRLPWENPLVHTGPEPNLVITR